MKILYEDKDILVIDKPSGISVHPDGKSKEKSITDWVLKNYPKMKNVGEPMRVANSQVESNQVFKVKSKSNFQLSTFNFITIPRPGVVHRLDKGTSGVLILAKNQKTYEFLKEQFQSHKIKKTYIAIVNGWPKNDWGLINKPIGRSPSDFRRRLAGRGARGEMREATTEYKVLKRFKEASVPFSILEVYPKTGRTHQIRVHLKYLSFPIVCDSLYNPTGVCPKGLKRMGLHAKSIEFESISGKKIKVESPLPKEFKKVLKYQDETRD